MREENRTGYPSIDKPWLKHYNLNSGTLEIPNSCICDYLYSRNHNHLDNIALIYKGRKITYKNLFKNIDKTAKSFVAHGVKAGDIITMCPVNTPEFVYSFYALNKIGAIISMVLPTASEKEIVKYLKDTHSSKLIILDAKCNAIANVVKEQKKYNLHIDWVLVCSLSISMSKKEIISSLFDKETLNISKKISHNYKNSTLELNEFICWKDFLKIANKKFSINSHYESNKTAVIVRSGGTTGVPKGIELTNENYNSMVIEHDKVDYLKLERGMTCL